MCSSPAPTMRSLAKEAGVTSMTVSLALRNNPKISVATRKRIQRLAKKRGYKPDPTVSRLMSHLRVQRSHRLQAMICGLTDQDRLRRTEWVGRIAEGARARAAELGFGFNLINLADYIGSPDRLERVLLSRGVEGLLLLPLRIPMVCDDVLAWNKFSVVSTSHSVISPEFCRVVSDQFNNMMLLCRELTIRGYRRIGLDITHEMEQRVRHNFTAALAWHNAYGGTETVHPLVTPPGNFDYRGLLVNWLEREKPDVIITPYIDRLQEAVSRIYRGEPPPFAYALVDVGQNRPDGGIDERGDCIGRTAMELLSGMILRGERGVPEVTKNMLIQGSFVPGALACFSEIAGRSTR
ncbi:LacI family transcriptional regulator [Oleiharenicola lentus]|uniref:LacI family transcriptional regulator n=2 Tax=Oleiharenicola lentus TaxID=2508720 RepID=A0A4Q1C5C3_9BACT|nr:LacI family transcriptional regulator [Oleiharenicola lentus]